MAEDAARASALGATIAHPLIAHVQARLSARSPVDVTDRPNARLAAVAAILRVRGEPELLFIKRADVAGDPWSGHVAFPGGRHEADDASLLHTALRETMEELSIDVRAEGQLIGRLDDISPRSPALPPVIIRPFVGIVGPDIAFVRSREVADAFWVPLAELVAQPSHVEEVRVASGQRARLPAYRVGPHVIWGITERIVRQLLAVIGEGSPG